MPIKLGNTYPEARDAVLLQRNSAVQPVFQRGIWTETSTNKTATFTNNPDFNVQSYSFAVTLKRLQNNSISYNGISALFYYSSSSDRFHFGLQNNESGLDGVYIMLQLNSNTALTTLNVAIGQTIKFVGIYDGSFGVIYYGSSMNSANVIRPINTRPFFSININHPDFEVTNYGWWLRELSIKEKNDYMNGNMKAFQTPV